MRLNFATSTPLEVQRGSGTFVGIHTLANALRRQGAEVKFVTPSIHLPIYTAQRLLFNQQLRLSHLPAADVTVGFDMDGYTLSRWTSPGLHVASIKGVIADEMRFESGITRATMRLQARCERIHVRTADVVLTTSRYSAQRIRELYGLEYEPWIVPELIDLEQWRCLLEEATPSPAESPSRRFTVLCVCRFYPRKRVSLLLYAAARLRARIPNLQIRIVGGGPEAPRLRQICRDENLGSTVVFREDISQPELAREYLDCDLFCLPSVQEGFGIVFLEAMAAGKPIIAVRAAAAPEVVPHALLVDPDNHEALGEGIENLYRDPECRQSIADKGLEAVKRFDAPLIARTFLSTIESILMRTRKTI